ncbi:PCMD domain-containing protein [Fibrobacter sp. UWEL]|uniref:PCMD domain-containing protein n=1 Tax=Fibrobacter sp. UWEL TaxID=1896209 RepID=UPI00091B3925|nr:PCMD domain-containing protein [Fibrobacter sp. UWEL]SHK67954.1 Putative carbohydrate metabolism domain-containing protein [Fibrobacter sp. UWEL]
MFNKRLNRVRWLGMLVIGLAFALTSCTEADKVSLPSNPDADGAFEDMDSVSVDVESGVIELPEGTDSLVISSLSSLGATYLYIATDDDPVDPAFDWDNPLEEGDVIFLKDADEVRVVALDADNRVVKIWTITKPAKEPASSSSVDESSSSSEKASEPAEESSSSKEIESSSSEAISSSSEVVSSSSEAESSSSEKIESSSTEVVSSSSEVVSSSSNEIESSSSEKVSEPAEESSSSSEADEPQLPGSDFTSWDKSFWGSTSDAMATSASASGVTMKAAANAEFESSKLTLTSRVIGGTAVLITAGHKLATGVYFAGSFEGEDCNSLYNANGDYPGLENSDFSAGMNMGQPFTGRPTSFDVSFAYEHVDGSNKDFPQKGLIYVILASADHKVVATGALILESSVAMTTQNVVLSYGKDPEDLLNSGFAIPAGLELGDGTEDVATVYVMFASSAYAHVAATNYRGGEGSQLILDDFKFNY